MSGASEPQVGGARRLGSNPSTIVVIAPPPTNPYTGGYLFNARVARPELGVATRFASARELTDDLCAEPPRARIWALDSLYLAELDPSCTAGHTVVQIVHSLPRAHPERVAQALAAAAGCIATSAFMAEAVNSRAPAARVRVCRPGVSATVSPTEAPTPAPVVLTVANFERRKGHLELLAALGRLRKLPWTWQLIGDPAADPECSADFARALAASGLASRVQLLGAQPPEQVQRAMANASVFALLSVDEPYGMVYAESVGSGTPVVAWRQGGVPETVTHEQTGLLATPGDLEHATTHLRALLGSAALRAQLRRRCVAAAAALPSWDACAREFAAHCRALAEVRA